MATIMFVTLMAIAIAFCVRRLHATNWTLLLLGFYWLVLTFTAEYIVDHSRSHNWIGALGEDNIFADRSVDLVLLTLTFGPILAGLKRSGKMAALILCQILGILFGVAAAAYFIETIVVSGPILFLSGLAIALVSYTQMRSWGFYFGLAAPTIAVSCFALICGIGWGPDRAHYPIAAILVVFTLVSVPVGFLSLNELLHPSRGRARLRFQFSIASLMGAMLLVAVLATVLRLPQPQATAWATAIIYGSIAVYSVRRFHAAEADRNER